MKTPENYIIFTESERTVIIMKKYSKPELIIKSFKSSEKYTSNLWEDMLGNGSSVPITTLDLGTMSS